MVHLSELEAMWPTSESLMKITKKATKAFFPKTMFLVQRPHSDEYKASSNINDLMETQKQIRNRHVLLINHIPFQFFCTISIGYYSSNRSEILLLNVLLTLPIFHIFFFVLNSKSNHGWENILMINIRLPSNYVWYVRMGAVYGALRRRKYEYLTRSF